MKKLFIILTFLLVFNNQTFIYAADSACPVKDWPSKELTKYFNDLKEVLSEVTKSVWNTNCWESGTWLLSQSSSSVSRWYSTIIWDSNGLFNFDWFLSSWELDMYPLVNWNLPPSTYRDHDYIVSQSDKINDITKAVAKKCALDNEIKSDIVAKKLEYYNLKSVTKIEDVLSEFRKFNIKLSTFFRCSVAGSLTSCELEWNEALKSDIKSSYVDGISWCNQSESSFKKFMKSIWEITDGEFWFKWIREWINEWKAALALLVWEFNDPKKIQEEFGRDLLNKELVKVWLKGNQADAILSNLDCMNKTNKTLIDCTYERVKTYWEPLSEVVDKLFDSDIKDATSTNLPTKNIWNTADYDQIAREINSDHSNLLTTIKLNNKSSDTWISNLIQLHKNLIDTNNKIEWKVSSTVMLCNKQATWVGNCNAK